MFDSNPALSRSLDNSARGSVTVAGVIRRTAFLLGLVGAAFAVTWHGVSTGVIPMGFASIASIAGLLLGLAIIFLMPRNPVAISLYAVLEGAILGTIGYAVEAKYPGVSLQALVGTFGCFAVVLTLYSFRVLRATPGFVKVVIGLMLGVLALYLVDIVASAFGSPLGFLHDSSPLSIGISIGVCLLASISFVIDFSQIEDAVGSGVEEGHAWQFAFGLLVGLIWLYLEVLRLLIKLRSSD